MAFGASQRGQGERPGLLALVLFGILLCTVGGAYLVVAHRRQIPARRGAEILRRIRADGLEAAWGTDDLALTYIGRDRHGRIKTAIKVLRQRVDAGYAGSMRFESDQGAVFEQWEISNDTTRCLYVASGEPGMLSATTIKLADGNVSVNQVGREGPKAAASTVPDNYIPEGIMHLVMHRVVGAGRAASFRIILNSQAIVDNKVQMSTVHMQPTGPDRLTVISSGLGSQTRYTYYLDRDGLIVRFDDLNEGVVYRLANSPSEP